MTVKSVLVRLQGLRPRARAPLALFATPLFSIVIRKRLKSENCCEKVIGDGKNTEVRGRSPQPPEANGGLGRESPTLQQFFHFFQKNNTAFLYIFWSKFLLKSVFLIDC